MKLYVHDDFGRIVGIVSYNENLDHGNSPYHRGITRLRSGEYVLIDSAGSNTKPTLCPITQLSKPYWKLAARIYWMIPSLLI